MAEALVAAGRVTRTGQGFDAHRWGPGYAVWLCGVKIEHDAALIGHSDADAGLHAITDAILGAIGEGDIGDHFPPSDPQWRGVSSDVFLTKATELVPKEKRFRSTLGAAHYRAGDCKAAVTALEKALELDKGGDALKESYLAKNYVSQSALKVTDNGVQVLGGHGYIREHPVEMWLRDARGFSAIDGIATV